MLLLWKTSSHTATMLYTPKRLPSPKYSQHTDHHQGLKGVHKALLSEGSASQEDYGITPGDRHLFGLPCDASDFALISSATSWWVLVKRASNNIFNHQCCIISFNQPPSLIISNLGDETTVTATFHGFLTISQGKKFNSLYPPTFQLSLVCINQLDLVGYTTSFRCGISSIVTDSTSIIATRTDDF